jgi:hypothetical protein
MQTSQSQTSVLSKVKQHHRHHQHYWRLSRGLCLKPKIQKRVPLVSSLPLSAPVMAEALVPLASLEAKPDARWLDELPARVPIAPDRVLKHVFSGL